MLTLADGSIVDFRLGTSDDAEAIVAFLDGLSEEARRLRFPSGIWPALVQDLAGPNSMLSIRNGQVVGIANLEPHRDGITAEMNWVVADQWWGQRIGTTQFEALAEVAHERGFTRLRSSVDLGNIATFRILLKHGEVVSSWIDRSYVIVPLPLVQP